jgi:tetratricopeptide (TPR) repeat protein
MIPAGPARRVTLGLVALVLAAQAALPLHAAPIKGLTHAEALARAYDLVYDADFAGAEEELKRACGPAPAQACGVIGVAAQWWRIYFDLDSRAQDKAFLTRLKAVIDGGEHWVAREPERAEAWFYLGAAYGIRVQYHGQRFEFLAAARDGKRIKNALEKSLALDPGLHDANAGVGMYQYYADVAPAVLKILRWFLGLPGGDKARGLEQMRRARDQGVLMRTEATYQLHLVDLWYENKTDEALSLLADLRARYPHNPLFLLNAAQVQEVYRQDSPAALALYRALVDGARSGGLHEPVMAEVWGRLGAAAQLDALAESDRAIDELRIVIERRPAVPYGAVAQAQLELGRVSDRVGWRDQAVAAYRAAIASAPADDPRNIRRAAQEGLSHPADRVAAEAARLSLEGWRAFESGSLLDAAARLARAVQLRPDDGVHRYRHGRVLAARQDRARAQTDFERALQARPAPPPPFVAASYLALGSLFDAASDRARAIAMYEAASRVRGASPETRDLAQRALVRLR